MIKHLSQITGVAAFAVIASSASAEIKLNDNLFIDGYATAAAVVTEPSPGVKDKVLLDNGRVYDSAKIALNGKYEAFNAKVSGLLINGDNNADLGTNVAPHNFGLLDAYVSYTNQEWVVTAGKYLGFLGYESWDSPNNAFISFSNLSYNSPYSTGAKIEYITKEYSTGVSVRDSQFETANHGKLFNGDGNFGDDLGYEAYFLYTGIDKVKIFAGAGFQDQRDYATNSGAPGYESISTYDFWVSYDLTSKLTLAAEVATYEDVASYSWNVLANYAFTSEFSAAARVTGGEAADLSSASYPSDTFGYGLASTYVLTKNFSVKGEVTMTEKNAGEDDVFSYALQGVLKF